MQIKLCQDKLVGLHQDQDTFTPSCPGSGLPRCDCSWWRRSPQSAEVLAQLGWGAQVGLAPDPQLAVAVGAPVVQEALIHDGKCVGIAADHAGTHDALEGGHPLRVELVDVVADIDLPVTVVSPAEQFP